MADKQAANDNGRLVSDAAGEAEKKPPSLVERIADTLGKVWDFVTGDEYINAMARQGANELGSALKAFPDSIAEYRWVHADENDSQAVGRSPWPSEIAEANRMAPPRDSSNDQGHDAGSSL